VSEARFTGLSGADALPDSPRDGKGDSVMVNVVADLDAASDSAGGAVLLRKKLERPKRLRFFAGDSIMVTARSRLWEERREGRRGKMEKGVGRQLQLETRG
jgi:hypothetical protein